jgi:phosphomannomutase
LCHSFICETLGMDEPGRTINVAAMEQSNGFSILGGPPPDERSLGVGGHVRDKDGTLAAILVAEVAAYAKEHGASLMDLVDRHVYLDPDVGLFVNLYEPDPLDGEYPGIAGDKKKMAILRRTLAQFQLAKAGGHSIGSLPVHDAVIHRTGKYDHVYPPTYDFQFPDEGVKFYFDAERLNWALVRPSGTGNSMRFHVQLHSPVDAHTLADRKRQLNAQAQAIVDDLRIKLGAPRDGE